MNIHQFAVGEKEYTAIQLDAFRANAYLLKLKSKLGSALSGGMDGNAANLLGLIDERTLDELIFPLFKDCAVTCTSERQKLDGKEAMNKLFDASTLDDFYVVAWEVVKFNFGPFISKMAKNLFGVDLETLAPIMKEKLKEIGASLSEVTSTPNTGSGVQ